MNKPIKPAKQPMSKAIKKLMLKLKTNGGYISSLAVKLYEKDCETNSIRGTEK